MRFGFTPGIERRFEMDAYLTPAWTMEDLSDGIVPWGMPVDWVTIAATVLISVGTTLITDQRD